MDRDAAAWWLAGFVDGEGSIANCLKSKRRAVQISNTDYGLIETCVEALEVLGIRSHVYKLKPPTRPNCKQVWSIHIFGREHVTKFAAIVPVQCAAKRQRLLNAVGSYCDSYIGPIAPPPRKELADLHVRQGLSVADVAKRYDVDRSTATKWLERAGLLRSASRAQYLRSRRERRMLDGRDNAIRAERRSGVSVATIAERFDLSAPRVYQILNMPDVLTTEATSQMDAESRSLWRKLGRRTAL